MENRNMNLWISELITYGIETGLVDPADENYTINRILDILGEEEFSWVEPEPTERPETIFDKAGFEPDPDVDPDDYAYYNRIMAKVDLGDYKGRPLAEILQDIVDAVLPDGTTEEKDLLDTKIMGALTPPPSEVRKKFRTLARRHPKNATDWYYNFSKLTNYIRVDRVRKDERWTAMDMEYKMCLDMSINLSKPEKDPRDIAKAGKAKKSGYPACLLCAENEGYPGHIGHPARQNHRLIPMTLAGEKYYLQYSPYVYYNEHCIVLNEKHVPMKIDRDTFRKLLCFLDRFPHYTIGSNADLPIVGGSILSHDHFQGGRYLFPMATAEEIESFSIPGFPEVWASIVKWPLSTIRLQCKDADKLVDAADRILQVWRGYTDEEVSIYSETDGVPHNTITPIARMRDIPPYFDRFKMDYVYNETRYEMDLVLRNNLTTEEHPLGLFHPHEQYHHIKKENIGLIEVMGLAILPGRLKKEMKAVADAIISGKDLREDPLTASHADWVEEWLPLHADHIDQAMKDPDKMYGIIQHEITQVFARVLDCCGVFKQTPEGQAAFHRFLEKLQ